MTNTDSRELKYFKRVIVEPYMNNGSLVNYQYKDCTAEVNRYTVNKQKELLDELLGAKAKYLDCKESPEQSWQNCTCDNAEAVPVEVVKNKKESL